MLRFLPSKAAVWAALSAFVAVFIGMASHRCEERSEAQNRSPAEQSPP